MYLPSFRGEGRKVKEGKGDRKGEVSPVKSAFRAVTRVVIFGTVFMFNVAQSVGQGGARTRDSLMVCPQRPWPKWMWFEEVYLNTHLHTFF